MESFFVTSNLSSVPAFSVGPPLSIASVVAPAAIRIVSVAGKNVPNPPAGDAAMPDVSFAVPGTITISLATTNIPPSTRLTVRIAAGGQVIEVQSAPTKVDGTTTATATVPAGIGTIQAFAEYLPPTP